MAETNFLLKGLKNRSDLHMARKIWHVTGVFILFLTWVYFSKPVFLAGLVLAWLVFVPVDFVRHKNSNLNVALTGFFRPIMRNSELNKLAGTTYLLTGALIISLIFNRGVVSLSLLFLAFADPIASFVGIKFGKDKILGHKSLQGFVAAFVVCFVSSLAFLSYNQIQEYVLIFSLLAGLVGALAELIPFAKLDDNLTMPLVSSVGLSGLFYLFGYFSYFT